MHKRNIIVKILIVVVVLFTIGTNVLWAQSEIDIDRIWVIFQKGFHYGVPQVDNWGIEFYVDFARESNLNTINITKVGDEYPFATMWPSDQPGHWEWYSPLLYDTYEELRNDYQDGTYKFEFLTSDDVLLRTVYLDIIDMPGEPENPVEFTYPATPGQTGVNLNPTFTWNVNNSDGDTLMMAITNEDSEVGDIYFDNGPVSMDTTSWEPGPLSANTEYSLWVSVSNVKDWEISKPLFPTMIVDGDEFEYTLMVEYFNEFLSFTTTPIDIVPDTIRTNTKSITCHVWPLDSHDVTDIDLNSIRLNDEIKPSSVRIRQQMLIVKFPTSGLILDPGVLELTVDGIVGSIPFEGTDYVEVIQKGGKPN